MNAGVLQWICPDCSLIQDCRHQPARTPSSYLMVCKECGCRREYLWRDRFAARDIIEAVSRRADRPEYML